MPIKIVPFCVLVLVFGLHSGQSLPPSLGIERIVLQWQGQRLIAEMSTSGTYVAALAYEREADDGYVLSLHVWETARLFAAPDLDAPVASQRIDTEEGRTDFTISPDERYLALLTSESLQVFTLPELHLFKSLSVEGHLNQSHLLSWSPDSQFIGALVASGIAAWNLSDDELYSYEINTSNSTRLHTTSHGWLLDYSQEILSSTFFLCTWTLSDCGSFIYEGLNTLVISSTGNTVLTVRGEYQQPEVGVWLYQGDTSYDLNEMFVAEAGECPYAFSPSERYITFWCLGHEVNIHRFDTQERLHRLSNYRFPMWFSDEQYFVTMSPSSTMLQLYRLGEETPLEEVNVLQGVNLYTERSHIVGISPDDNFILIQLDTALILLRIEYR